MTELHRLRTLHRYRLLDTEREERFDRIARLARQVLDVPMVAISLIDRDRQWFKARLGLETDQTARSISFCTHAIAQREPLIVEDARDDVRFRNSPLVTGEPFIRYYAGAQLRTHDGQNIGALCGMDRVPRTISAAQIAALQDLARLTIDQIEMRSSEEIDSGTGAMSRNRFVFEATREINRAKRYRCPLSIGILDVDDMESFNRDFGASAGDILLQRIYEICVATLRRIDLIGRLGGDEFAILMPETDLLGGFEAMERLRKTVCSLALQRPVSVTIGVVEYSDAEWDFDDLARRADSALLQGVLRGGNCTVADEDTELRQGILPTPA